MNNGLYNDWAHKRITMQSYRMDKIRDRKKKRSKLMLNFLIPGSVSFLIVGGFTLAQSFTLLYLICSFIIAVGMSVMIYLDDADNKKFMKILEAWSDVTDVRLLPPSIRDTFN